jgi:hypothetical protein
MIVACRLMPGRIRGVRNLLKNPLLSRFACLGARAAWSSKEVISLMTVHVLHAGDGYTYLTRQVAQRHRDGAFRPAGLGNTSGLILSTVVIIAPAATLKITLRCRGWL